MICAVCQHESFDHGKYEWLRVNGELELLRVSEGCVAVIDLGGDQGRPCGCVRFRAEEEESEHGGTQKIS